LQVKEHLESGCTLHSPLFEGVVAQFASFVVAAGIVRYNYYLLPIFTFIRKCCGVSEHQFNTHLHNNGISSMVFAEAGMAPRPETPLTPALLLSAATQQVCSYPKAFSMLCQRLGSVAEGHIHISQPYLFVLMCRLQLQLQGQGRRDQAG
jgi:hypothetical protein